MSKIEFQAVVRFEIKEQEAVNILASGDDNQQAIATSVWFSNHCPSPEIEEHYNRGLIKEALGKHLAESRIEAARQLTLNVEQVETP